MTAYDPNNIFAKILRGAGLLPLLELHDLIGDRLPVNGFNVHLAERAKQFSPEQGNNVHGVDNVPSFQVLFVGIDRAV